MQQQEDQLQNVLSLIEKTGDKAVVLEKGKPAYVMMRLKDYEGLILGKSEIRGLTEEELLDKINRDIAIWRSEREEQRNLEEELPEIPPGPEWDTDWDRGWDRVPDRIGERVPREPWEDEPWLEDEIDDDIYKARLKEEIDREIERDRWKHDKDAGIPSFEEDRYYVEAVR